MANIVRYETESGEVTLSPEIVKRYLVHGQADKVTDQELLMFLRLCQYQKLNPFLREAYLIKYGNEANIVVGKEVFMKRASRNENCRGWEAGIVISKKDGSLEYRQGSLVVDGENLVGGWAKVYKANYQVPIEATVSLKEYNRGTATWKSMPATMIRKVALVQALREAFPEDFEGLYSAEEMPIDDSDLSKEPINITPEADTESALMCTDAQYKKIIALGKQKKLNNEIFKQIAKDVTGKATTKVSDFTYEEAENVISYLDQLPVLDHSDTTVEESSDKRPITEKQHKRLD